MEEVLYTIHDWHAVILGDHTKSTTFYLGRYEVTSVDRFAFRIGKRRILDTRMKLFSRLDVLLH